MKQSYPLLWYVYATIVGISSLMIPFGFHRDVYALLRSFAFPEAVISGMAGLTNLCWYEIAYLVGGGLKNVNLYDSIPYVASTTGLLSAVLLVFSKAHFRQWALWFHLGLSILLGILGLAVLGWRMVRHMEDPWRLITAIAFFCFYSYWLLYFQRTKRFFLVTQRAT